MMEHLKAFFRRILHGEDPVNFVWVGEGVGEPVGPPIYIQNYANPDDMRNEAHARMTKLVRGEDLDANAIEDLHWLDPMGGGVNISKIQPRRV